jgi:molybdate transport system substrate-binding protein
MKRLAPVVLLTLIAAAFIRTPQARSQDNTLTVFAASSLTNAFTDLGAQFEAANPGRKVVFNFGASSQLRTQLDQGAPADVFASADYAQMEPLVKSKRVGAPQTIARNRLTIVIPARNPGKVRSAQDLARKGLRFVTTAENVPIGRYTQEVLQKLSGTRFFNPGFAEKVNANVVSRESNVRSVLAKVELGEADAAIVYASDARMSRKVRTVEIPRQANVTALYPIAVVLDSAHPKEAERFYKLVLSHKGSRTLRSYGFQ